MRYIPTEKELNTAVKLVEITVKGTYIAAKEGGRKIRRPYETKVTVPDGFTKSDIKRITPRVLLEHNDYPDFVMMRTFEQTGRIEKTTKRMKLREFYSDREIARFARMRKKIDDSAKKEVKAMGDEERGIAGDTSEYDPDTGLPPVFNDEIGNDANDDEDTDDE